MTAEGDPGGPDSPDDPDARDTPDASDASAAPGASGTSGASTDETSHPDPFQRTVLIAGAALLVALAVTVLVTSLLTPRLAGRPRLAFFIQLKLLLSTFNVLVLLALAGIYGSLYRDLPNQFTLSLVLFSVALLLYAFTSNPIVHFVFGFRGGPGLGPFAAIPDLFASVAIVVLLYQSYR